MKNLFLYLLGLIFISCYSVREYTITANLDGLEDGKAYLNTRVGGEWLAVDSVETTEGTFVFTGTVDMPDYYYISLEGKRGRLAIFIENSDITVTGYADTIYKAKITGSSVQDEYKAYSEELNKYWEKYGEMRMELIEFRKAGDEAKASELEAEVDKIYEDIQQFSKDYVTEHPASYISPYVLRSVSYRLSGAEIEAELEKLDAALSKSGSVIELAERAEVLKRVAVGEKFLDFTQNDPDGNPVTLSSLVGENYLLIDFWAAWCGPCRAENPNLVAVYNDYKDKGFDILGVSLDRNRNDWLKAIEDDTLTWTQVSDLNYWKNEASKAYGINSIPSNLLLDKDGIIIEKNIRGEELRIKISELLD